MGEKHSMDWCPFVYGGLASIVAELGNLIHIDIFPVQIKKSYKRSHD